jgi:hypothetical protein
MGPLAGDSTRRCGDAETARSFSGEEYGSLRGALETLHGTASVSESDAAFGLGQRPLADARGSLQRSFHVLGVECSAKTLLRIASRKRLLR